MGKDYFGDILDDADDRMGCSVEEPFKCDGPKILSIKVKQTPDKGLALAQGMDMVAGKAAGAVDFKQKMEFKAKINNENSIKLTATNKDFGFEYDFNPEDLNKDGMHCQLEVEGKYMPAKSDCSGKAEFKIGGFEIGPLKPWTEIQFDTNKSLNHELTFSQNLNMDDYNVAYKAITDMKTLTSAYGAFAVKNKTGDFFIRANLLNKFVGVGCHVSPKSTLHHANELQYDFSGKNKGIAGSSVFYRFGGVYHLPNKTKLTTQISASKKWMWTNKWEVPVTSNIKATVTDQTDVAAYFTDPTASFYKLGLALEFKL